jgi:hypothetical protein
VTVRRVAYFAAGATLISSGIYVLVYLYRWEWHRAIVAGVIFVAAEVGIATAMVLSRLRSIERRLDDRVQTGATLDRLRETAPPARDPFAWLRPERQQMNVFVPFLMGAGFIVSAIAWGVERVAGATAKPALERGLALRLQPLSLPAGGFVGPPTTRIAVTRTRARRDVVRRVVLFLALVGIAGMSIDALADLTQDRPDVAVQGSETAFVLDVDHRTAHVNAAESAEAYWVTCQRMVPGDRTADITALAPGRAELAVSPPLGEHTLKRFQGCLQDANFDRLQARVVSVGVR